MSTGVRFQQRKFGAICCGHVFRGERKVLLVGKLGGDWQFMCGGKDHFGSKDGHFVIVGVLLDSDPSLNEIAGHQDGRQNARRLALPGSGPGAMIEVRNDALQVSSLTAV